MDGESLPEPLASYVAAVSIHPAQITDEDVQALQQAGFTEDQIFEATVSSALGAGRRRLDAGLAAMREADDAA
jgi:alkylhydroperoxidase family enzyme